MHLATWAATDTGQVRKLNEDNHLLVPDIGLVAVADGMGGFQRGDVASALACNVIKESILAGRAVLDRYRATPNEPNRVAIRSLVEESVQRACEEVHQAAVAITGEGGRIGTTIDLVLVAGTTAFTAHVGDGRIYLLRGHEAHQLTEDHTLVQQQLREGLLTAEEARKAKFKNVITRALGVFPSVMIDTLTFELDRSDRLLLCTDGLYRYVGLRELGFTLGGPISDDTALRLVALANERGGRDNITVVLAAADQERTGEFVPPTRARMEILRKVDLFQYCTYRELMAVCQAAEQRSVAADTVLFRDGEIGRELFVVEQGRVGIDKGGVPLAELGPAEYFGEMSFLDTPRRSADARTIVDSSFLVLRRDRFLQLVKQDSDLAAKVMWQLLQKLTRLVRQTNEKLVEESISLDDDDERQAEPR
jgi:serine/threonine protein phosphatase PrpC